jgi:hypothetical protein
MFQPFQQLIGQVHAYFVALLMQVNLLGCKASKDCMICSMSLESSFDKYGLTR